MPVAAASRRAGALGHVGVAHSQGKQPQRGCLSAGQVQVHGTDALQTHSHPGKEQAFDSSLPQTPAEGCWVLAPLSPQQVTAAGSHPSGLSRGAGRPVRVGQTSEWSRGVLSRTRGGGEGAGRREGEGEPPAGPERGLRREPSLRGAQRAGPWSSSSCSSFSGATGRAERVLLPFGS